MAAFVARYASAFADVVTAAKAGYGRDRRQLTDFLATWEGSSRAARVFENPAIPAVQKVGFWTS
jgi:hypothetical protein